jgi:hypothetical protein
MHMRVIAGDSLKSALRLMRFWRGHVIYQASRTWLEKEKSVENIPIF